uniref:Fork-head domain-containing protein n=1 Tax=Elaeophora elaphi TaxID=1147741 RepID=A0A0R3RVJ5_9BILA
MSKRRSDNEPKAGCSKDRDTTISQSDDDSRDVRGGSSSCEKTKYRTRAEEWPPHFLEEVKKILTSHTLLNTPSSYYQPLSKTPAAFYGWAALNRSSNTGPWW